MLQLIDSMNMEMAPREDWCPVGRGVIPCPILLRGVRPDAVVLEFEDEHNPIASRTFLAELFCPRLAPSGFATSSD